jgi:hypothetical protein
LGSTPGDVNYNIEMGVVYPTPIGFINAPPYPLVDFIPSLRGTFSSTHESMLNFELNTKIYNDEPPEIGYVGPLRINFNFQLSNQNVRYLDLKFEGFQLATYKQVYPAKLPDRYDPLVCLMTLQGSSSPTRYFCEVK